MLVIGSEFGEAEPVIIEVAVITADIRQLPVPGCGLCQNIIFTDLKRTDYIIFSTKSQFYKSEIVIIKYLYNSNRLLKALKYDKYITKTGIKGKKECI